MKLKTWHIVLIVVVAAAVAFGIGYFAWTRSGSGDGEGESFMFARFGKSRMSKALSKFEGRDAIRDIQIHNRYGPDFPVKVTTDAGANTTVRQSTHIQVYKGKETFLTLKPTGRIRGRTSVFVLPKNVKRIEIIGIQETWSNKWLGHTYRKTVSKIKYTLDGNNYEQLCGVKENDVTTDDQYNSPTSSGGCPVIHDEGGVSEEYKE